MRKYFAIFTVLLIGAVCLADPSPSPSASAVVVGAAGQTLFQTIVAWIMAHQIVVGGFLAAALDFAFALVPSWKSNGVLHWLYLFFRKKAGLPDLPPA